MNNQEFIDYVDKELARPPGRLIKACHILLTKVRPDLIWEDKQGYWWELKDGSWQLYEDLG